MRWGNPLRTPLDTAHLSEEEKAKKQNGRRTPHRRA
jgi:hypothetical protein